jgi:Formiminotransferase-cyclodeaminase
MQHTECLAAYPLGEVIEAIASDSVAPGAGSAAAVGLALAAACAGKAVAITLKRRPEDMVLQQAREALAQTAHRALHGADEDAARFREFTLEKDAVSAQQLLDSSKRLQHVGRALLAVLDRVEERIDSAVRGDITAARALCAAFREIQSENLAENRAAAERTSGE